MAMSAWISATANARLYTPNLVDRAVEVVRVVGAVHPHAHLERGGHAGQREVLSGSLLGAVHIDRDVGAGRHKGDVRPGVDREVPNVMSDVPLKKVIVPLLT